jgi:hypothetical protein
MRPSPKQHAAAKVDAAIAVGHLEQALVEARMVASAGPNNPVRQNLTNAKAHATAALGQFAILQGKVNHEPR